MKRFGVLLTSVYLVSGIVGCGGGGVQEGSPPGPVKSAQTAEFKDMMEKAGKKMMMKGRPKDSSSSTKKGP
jgi:hypothetical protein